MYVCMHIEMYVAICRLQPSKCDNLRDKKICSYSRLKYRFHCENRTEQRPGKKHPGGGKKKPGRCPKPEPLMDPGPAAQTPEAKRRKIKRHAGQMPDTAWPSQGQPKMVFSCRLYI